MVVEYEKDGKKYVETTEDIECGLVTIKIVSKVGSIELPRIDYKQGALETPKFANSLQETRWWLASEWYRGKSIEEMQEIENRFCSNDLIGELSKEIAWSYNDCYWIVNQIDAPLIPAYPRRADDLETLYRDWVLAYTDKAYYLRARDNDVIAIKVRDDAPKEIYEALQNFPVDYAEYNREEKTALYLVRICEDDIPEKTKQIFDTVIVARGDGFEICCNWYRIKFTKNQLDTDKWTKFDRENPEHHKRIRSMLEKMERLDVIYMDYVPPFSLRDVAKFQKDFFLGAPTPYDKEPENYFKYYDEAQLILQEDRDG